MEPVQVEGIAELQELIGRELGPTDWVEVTQEDIDRFADVSRDHQWIHVDPGRAAKESPYGTTVAHGNLTLSLLDFFRPQLVADPRQCLLRPGTDGWGLTPAGVRPL